MIYYLKTCLHARARVCVCVDNFILKGFTNEKVDQVYSKSTYDNIKK